MTDAELEALKRQLAGMNNPAQPWNTPMGSGQARPMPPTPAPMASPSPAIPMDPMEMARRREAGLGELGGVGTEKGFLGKEDESILSLFLNFINSLKK